MALSAKHGKSSAFKLDNAAGTLTAITKYLDSIDFPRNVEQIETTVIGSEDKDYLQSFIGGQFTLSGKLDPALFDIVAAALGGAARTFEYGPEGTASGKVRYTGELVVLSVTIDMAVGEANKWQATCRTDGTITRDTF